MFHSAEPFIQREISRKTWIYDVIEGRRETEHVHFNCDQYVILPDSDSQPQQPQTIPFSSALSSSPITSSSSAIPAGSAAGGPPSPIIHWLTIFKDLSLRSIRDLRGYGGGTDGMGHLPMLRRLRSILQTMFPLQDTMIYFHYPPSVWQLHIHIAHPCDQLRTTNEMQKVHFLDDVMRNLQIDPDYYAQATITYILSSNHDLVRTYHQPYGYHHYQHRRNNSSDDDAGCSSAVSSSSSSSSSSLSACAHEPEHEVQHAVVTQQHNNKRGGGTGATEPRHPVHHQGNNNNSGHDSNNNNNINPQKNNAPTSTSPPKHNTAPIKHGGSQPPPSHPPPVATAATSPTATTSNTPSSAPRRNNRQASRIAPRAAEPLPA